MNVVFESPGAREAWAAALGALGAHVCALIGTGGVGAAARQSLAESLAGVASAEFPRAVAAAELELDKSLARGVCTCAVRCGGRFCRQQLKVGRCRLTL